MLRGTLMPAYFAALLIGAHRPQLKAERRARQEPVRQPHRRDHQPETEMQLGLIADRDQHQEELQRAHDRRPDQSASQRRLGILAPGRQVIQQEGDYGDRRDQQQ